MPVTSELLLEDMRQSFYAVENKISNLDSKAFGLATINSVFISFFTYLLTIGVNVFGVVSIILLIGSLTVLLYSIWPREWLRPDGKATIKKYWESPPSKTADQLVVNYAGYEQRASSAYDEKMRWFKISLKATCVAVVLQIISFIYLHLYLLVQHG